eukprot:jgi/Bigna1/126593/aug1.3_g1301
MILSSSRIPRVTYELTTGPTSFARIMTSMVGKAIVLFQLYDMGLRSPSPLMHQNPSKRMVHNSDDQGMMGYSQPRAAANYAPYHHPSSYGSANYDDGASNAQVHTPLGGGAASPRIYDRGAGGGSQDIARVSNGASNSALDSDAIPAQLSVREGLLGQRIQDLESHGESVTIMCVGESGVGKSTLLSNIFTVPIVHSVPKPTVKIVETSVKFECDGIPITVHLIDTPGYGDGMDIRKSFSYVKDYLEAKFQQSLKRETQIERQDRHSLDTSLGVDAILYFFSPHRCKTVDLEFLKSIQGYATIIPILAKADTMTADELAEFRSTVIKKLKATGIKVFHSPFAIISSPYVVRSHQNSRGELIHGREYPWGTAESENELHSDLPALRRCLITEGLSELHEATRRYYERYRAMQLTRKNSLFARLRRAITGFVQTALVIFAIKEAPRIRGDILGGFGDYFDDDERGVSPTYIYDDVMQGRGASSKRTSILKWISR